MLVGCRPANALRRDRRRFVHEQRDQWARMLAAAGQERAVQPLRICELCVQLAGVSGAGISVVTVTRNRGVVCSTNVVARQIEELQLEAGEGPCVDAARQGGPVMVPDVDELEDVLVDRWPGFLSSAREVGVKALFALPLRIGAIGVGVMDLYRDSAASLTDEELSFALMAADAAALSLLYLDGDDGGDPVSPSFGDAHVHQATGMVSVQMGVPVEEALLLLRARAYATERPLTELARDVVARGIRFSSEVDG
jgi:GAF domain